MQNVYGWEYHSEDEDYGDCRKIEHYAVRGDERVNLDCSPYSGVSDKLFGARVVCGFPPRVFGGTWDEALALEFLACMTIPEFEEPRPFLTIEGGGNPYRTKELEGLRLWFFNPHTSEVLGVSEESKRVGRGSFYLKKEEAFMALIWAKAKESAAEMVKLRAKMERDCRED